MGIWRRYLVGGLEHEFYDSPYIGNSNPNWRTPSFFRGWNHQPGIRHMIDDVCVYSESSLDAVFSFYSEQHMIYLVLYWTYAKFALPLNCKKFNLKWAFKHVMVLLYHSTFGVGAGQKRIRRVKTPTGKTIWMCIPVGTWVSSIS